MTAQTGLRPMTLAAVAEALDGRLVGDGTLPVTAVVHPLDVVRPTDLALAMSSDEFEMLPKSPARIAVVAETAEVPAGRLDGYVVVQRSRYALAILTRLFERPVHFERGRHPSAAIDPTATVGAEVSIGAFAYVGPGASIGRGTAVLPHVTIGAGAQIGEDCLFHPGVRIGDRVVIGNRVIIHMNAVIGADGFSFVTPEPGSIESVRQTGKVGALNTEIVRINSVGAVVIEDDVEIGACATVDRATIANTVVRRGTKIDNLVTIAHNTTVGENCLIAGQVGVAGSCRIGDRVVMGGKVGIADHIDVGDDAILTAGSRIARDVPPKSVMIGYPAVPREQAIEQLLGINRLGRMQRTLETLERRVAVLEARTRAGEGR